MPDEQLQSREAEARAPVAPLGFGGRLRAYFLAGVLVVAPISITFYIAYLILDFVDSRVNPHIPAAYNPNNYLPFGIPGLGLVIVLVAITLIGATTAGYLGRVFVRLSEMLLVRMPVINGIYSAVKQLVEAVFSQKASAFRQVVLVEWPHAGSWTLGFVTVATAGEIQGRLPADVVSIMVPTTPNPTGGYLVFVPRHKVIPLEMSVDAAMKMILSSGIVVPPDTAAQAGRAAAAKAEKAAAP
ncbi:MAG: DUF502 domain-containing protein [Alphaproteobacteria bacterium]